MAKTEPVNINGRKADKQPETLVWRSNPGDPTPAQRMNAQDAIRPRSSVAAQTADDAPEPKDNSQEA